MTSFSMSLFSFDRAKAAGHFIHLIFHKNAAEPTHSPPSLHTGGAQPISAREADASRPHERRGYTRGCLCQGLVPGAKTNHEESPPRTKTDSRYCMSDNEAPVSTAYSHMPPPRLLRKENREPTVAHTHAAHELSPRLKHWNLLKRKRPTHLPLPRPECDRMHG